MFTRLSDTNIDAGCNVTLAKDDYKQNVAHKVWLTT